jgi:MBG domain (YGX type)
VRNGSGSQLTSAVATLVVNAAVTAPIITDFIPANHQQSVKAGSIVSFQVFAAGTELLTYQWQRFVHGYWTDITGETEDTFSTAPMALADSPSAFRCLVRNKSSAMVVSPTVTVTVVATSPSIMIQPASQTVSPRGTATFSVTAGGSADLAYQWQSKLKNATVWSDVPSATSSTYLVRQVVAGDDGTQFRCTVANGGGFIVSSPATLAVTASAPRVPPSITGDPGNVRVTIGQSATFQVEAASATPLGYQWQRLLSSGWADISDATHASYTTPVVFLSDTGSKFRCVVSNNTNPSQISEAATLTVTAPVPMISWATPAAIVYGTALSATQLNAQANVPGTFRYAPPSGTVLGAGTSQTLQVRFTPTDTNAYASASATVSLTVNQKAITATADSLSRVYGAANPNFTITYTGFIGQDTETVLATKPTASCTATSSSGPGTYPINLVGGVDGNYRITTVAGTLTVTQAPQTITFGTLGSKTYGDSAFILGATTSGDGQVVYDSSTPTVATVTGNQVTIKAAGTTVITARQGGTANYAAAPAVSQILTIARAPLRVTATDQSRTVGAANPLFTADLTGLKGADTATSIGLALDFACAATSTSVPGSYPITVSSRTSLANYLLTYRSGTLTVKGVPVITWVSPADIVYGTALSATQLNAQANVPGTFRYTPADGTVLGVGTGQTLQVSFTPTDPVGYASVNAMVSLTVTKAPQTIDLASPLGTLHLGDPDFTPGGVASSGGVLIYTSSEPSVASIVNGKIHPVGVGRTRIIAAQDGDALYLPARTARVLDVLAPSAVSVPRTESAIDSPAATSGGGGCGAGTGLALFLALLGTGFLRRRSVW